MQGKNGRKSGVYGLMNNEMLFLNKKELELDYG